MKKHIDTSSLLQAVFSIVLATAHMLLCYIANEYWMLVALPASFWFFLVLPVLLLINLISLIYQSIKHRTINKKIVLYFLLTLPSYFIFSLAINDGCYVTV
tara:strand:- start:159 stop:461 length:303 start_codon:yes stop_codon:yes gene_type:complete